MEYFTYFLFLMESSMDIYNTEETLAYNSQYIIDT